MQSSPEPTTRPLPLPFAELITLIALLMALTALSIDIMLPALPEIGRALAVSSDNDRQLVVIVYMVGFSLGQLVYGPVSDRLGRRPVLLGGLGVFIAGTVAALLSTSFTGLLIARAVQGLGAASPRVVAIAVTRDLFSGRHMARVMSFAMMVFIIVPVLAPSLGQLLLHTGDWHATFLALLAVGVIGAAWVAWRLPETAEVSFARRSPLPLRAAFATALLSGQTSGYGAAGGFMFACLIAYVASSQQVLGEVFRFGPAFPAVFGAVASVMAAAAFINARIVGTYGMRRVSHTALTAFIIMALLLCALTASGHMSAYPFAVIVALKLFLFGLIGPNFNALAMEPQGHNAGTASSVIGSLNTAIGAAIGGAIGAAFDGSALPLAVGFAASSLMAGAIVIAIEGRAGLFGHAHPRPH